MLRRMKPSGAAWVLVVVLMASAAVAGGVKRPKLRLRVLPQWGPPSTEFLLAADLKGRPDNEDLYCPTMEWQWGPQDTSIQVQECPSFQKGVTPIERHFSTRHRFGGEGAHTVTLVLRKGDEVLARASVSVRVTWEKKPPTATFRDPR
jgi:hypothetical protein